MEITPPAWNRGSRFGTPRASDLRAELGYLFLEGVEPLHNRAVVVSRHSQSVHPEHPAQCSGRNDNPPAEVQDWDLSASCGVIGR